STISAGHQHICKEGRFTAVAMPVCKTQTTYIRDVYRTALVENSTDRQVPDTAYRFYEMTVF
ncbi:MAG: hypothetical protein ACFN1B_05510, partial [Prevotella denticola]